MNAHKTRDTIAREGTHYLGIQSPGGDHISLLWGLPHHTADEAIQAASLLEREDDNVIILNVVQVIQPKK